MLGSNKNAYLKLTSKPSYTPQKMFENSLFAIHKVTLKLKKQTYVGMSKLDLSKVLIHEFHFEYMKTCKKDTRKKLMPVAWYPKDKKDKR